MVSTPEEWRIPASASGEDEPVMTTNASIGRFAVPSRVRSGPGGGSIDASVVGSGLTWTLPVSTSLSREVTLLATLPSFETDGYASFRDSTIVVTTAPTRTNVSFTYGAA